MKFKLDDLEHALDHVTAGRDMGAEAWLDRHSGNVILFNDDFANDEDENQAHDLDDATRYLAMPDKRELDLGQQLALAFVRENLAQQYERVRDIFHSAGAYSRYKDLLEQHGALQACYDYEHAAIAQALRTWCEENDLPLSD